MTSLKDLEDGLGMAGQLRLDSVIASGGMGTVYRATQLSLDRPVAVKVLLRETAWGEDAERRFLAEAQLAGRISHPRVVRVLGSGSGPAGLYIVFELIEGQSLRAEIQRGLKPARSLELGAQLLQGLEAVHQSGAIHRDVKPENVLVDSAGNASLTDLGIAKELSGGHRTRVGLIFGTPPYMSPEQCAGKPVGPGSDIYSAGIVIYEMLTGTPPFDAENPLDLVTAHIRQPPNPPSVRNLALPRDWDAVLLRALEKTPERRYARAAEFAEALERLGGSADTTLLEAPASAKQAHVSSATARTNRPTSGRARSARSLSTQQSAASRPHATPRQLGIALAVAALAAAAGGLLWLSVHRTRVEAPHAVPAASSQAASPPTTTVAVNPFFGKLEPRLAQLALLVWKERLLEAHVEPHPDPDKRRPDSAVYLCEFLLLDVHSLVRPELRVRLPASPGARAPALTIDTAPEAGEASLTPEAGPGPGQWHSRVAASRLRDGINRVTLRVTGPAPRTVPAMELAFERPDGFPLDTLAAPPAKCDDCCPPRAQIDEFWTAFDSGALFRSLRVAEGLRDRWPRCDYGPVYIAYAYVRIVEETNRTSEEGLGLFTSVLNDDPRPPLPPTWKLWMTACDLLAETARLHPGTDNAWYRYSLCTRQLQRSDDSMRAGRWTVLVGPNAYYNWRRLLELEAEALSKGKTLGTGTREGDSRMTLTHADRCEELLTGEAGEVRHERSLLLLARGQALAAADRDVGAREAFQQALALYKGLREASRGLELLDRKAGIKKPAAPRAK
ncbi:MAG: serine/threonine protein kinase [Candidatus Wallbacteria bacterium]|nr:serine/threonine protein kinase [Candidatus Wallbacteria bacterium]